MRFPRFLPALSVLSATSLLAANHAGRPAAVTPPTPPTVTARAADLLPSPLRRGALETGTSLELTVDAASTRDADAASMNGRLVRLGGVPLPGGDTVDLSLRRIDPFTPDATIVVAGPGGRERRIATTSVLALAGEVEGDPDGEAFLCFSPAGVEGWIRTGGVAFGVSDGVDGGPLLVHRLDALPPIDPALLENFCGNDLLDQPVAFDPVRRPVDRTARSTNAAPPCKLVRLAIETDQELVGIFDGSISATTGYVATLVAASSSIYTRDFGVRLQIGWLRLWSDEDPWDAPDMGAQLGAFRDYWEGNMGHVDRDLTHFLSGRPLGGGVAWLGVLCSNYNYALSANLNGSFPYPVQHNHAENWDLMVFNHELGHNVGCPHTHDIGVDNCAGGDCSIVPNATIMSYCHGCPGGLANVRMEFCPENIANVAAHFAAVPCDFRVLEGFEAGDDFARVLPDETVLIDVLANDAESDCSSVFLDEFDAISAQGGTIVRDLHGGAGDRPALRYTPPANPGPEDSFTYSVADEDGVFVDEATVTIRIDVPLPPVNVVGALPGIRGEYYALSSPARLPDFGSLTPYAATVWNRIEAASTNGEFADTGRSDQVGVVWTGWIEVPASDSWTFGIESDDGSRLWIGDDLVVDNDGLHGMVDRTGSIELMAGRHPIRVEFFENGGGAGCIARIVGPGMSYGVIPDAMWSHGGTVADPADLNGDGDVDGADLGLLLGGWEQPGPTDLNGDGTTNGADLGLLLSSWTG
jgi:hypothetical protein